MSHWDQVYRRLPETERMRLNELTNAIFREQSGFSGKIDPQSQPELAHQWLTIRNRILANQQAFVEWLQTTSATVNNWTRAIDVFQLLDTTPAWIRVARSQIGTREIKGAQHNPRIMAYIRTCTNIQQTDAQRRYVEREGEAGVEWCSAFVNWCLLQAGIVGTNNALAASWKNWGTALDHPQAGAIATFSWKRNGYINHVAFCDDDGHQFRRLGGNQAGEMVSSVPLEKQLVVQYRWPAQL